MLRAFDRARQPPGPAPAGRRGRPQPRRAGTVGPEGVTFTGPVPYERVPEALAAADVFITASTSEVLPMSMIEALAAGAPWSPRRVPPRWT